MKRHRRDLRPITEINLTSLLDVSFVLLIAFMLVAPSLKYGVEIKLPTIAENQVTPAPLVETKNLATVTLTADGATVMLDDTPVPIAELQTRLTARRESNAKLAVEIKADRATPYEAFVRVVTAIRFAGIETVGLPVEAEGLSGATKVEPTNTSDNKDRPASPTNASATDATRANPDVLPVTRPRN